MTQAQATLASARASNTASTAEKAAALAAVQNERASFASARAERDKSAAALAAAKAFDEQARAIRSLHVANGNRQTGGSAASNVERMGGSMSGLAAQFQDVAVTAGMGMNPLMIALQQGTQITGQLEAAAQGGASAIQVLGQSFKSLFSPLAFATIAITALSAAGLQMVDWTGLAAGALDFLADHIQTIAPYATAAAAALALLYAPAMISGIVQIIALMGRLAVSAGIAAAAMAAANPALVFVAGLTVAITAMNLFRDDLARIFGVDVVGVVKDAVNAVIGAFVGGYRGIKAAWSALPGALGDIVYSTANIVLGGIETMINKAGDMVNAFIGYANNMLGAVSDELLIEGVIGPVKFGINNPYKGAAENVMAKVQKEIEAAQGQDYLGQIGEGISSMASAAAGKLREWSSALTSVEDASKKAGKAAKDAADEARKQAEAYTGIVNDSTLRVMSMLNEQAALGMTAEEAARLRYETDLLNQAQNAGITLTAGQKAELQGLAATMASVEAETARMKEQMDFAKGATNSFLSDLRNGLNSGKGFFESFGNAAMNVLNKIIDKLQNELVDALFSINGAGGKGGGGLFGGILGGIGKLFGFQSGGYTGNGPEGRVAGVVHGREFVMNAGATAQYRPMLEAMNDNRFKMPAAMPAARGASTPQVIDVRLTDDTGRMANIANQQIQTASGDIVRVSVSESTRVGKAQYPTYEADRTRRTG
ncbi:phage tail length tape measure family protein [Aureimonas populi]|uniref:Phage tail length tape measure family protein n=1 Tax=Aureimonas populi TaxID=1701758 RepID=A0ABW5CFA8_9HYPH|nr:phage tail length tape measure family protein [Aureimonas populi]